jgi:signal transduction histidine kinase
MLAPLTRLSAMLRFDPAKITLNWWLVASQVVVVLIVAGGISIYAIGRLHDLADERGISRVQLAGAMAREDLRRMSEDTLTQVRVLANRPTLTRLLAQPHLRQQAEELPAERPAQRPQEAPQEAPAAGARPSQRESVGRTAGQPATQPGAPSERPSTQPTSPPSHPQAQQPGQPLRSSGQSPAPNSQQPRAPQAEPQPLSQRAAQIRREHAEQLTLFLRRFCEADITIDACAVFDNGQLAGQAGAPVPWNDVVAANIEQGQSFLALPPEPAAPMMGAAADVTGRPDSKVYIVRLLNDKLAQTLSREVGLTIRLVNYRTFAAAPVDALTALHTAGLADGSSAVARIKALDLYAASFPIFASTGEAIALIEARLPAAEIDSSARRLTHRLLVTALVLAVLAVLASILLGQYVTGPVQALTAAAVRLGAGDFSTSIPSGGAAEVGALARTMEDMRRNLVDLTGTLRRREAEAQAVLAGIVEGVYAVDRNRVIRYLNPQAAKLLGVDPAAAVGRFCGDVLCPTPVGGVRPCETSCPIVQARAAGTARAVEHLQSAGQGPRTAVITSSGLVEGLQVQVIRDETELEAVRRARDSVLANISHEFRTPLAAQLASIELLRDGMTKLGPEERAELVLSLERGTLRLTRLIDNLLESVRIESGQLSIRRQSVALSVVIEDATALVESLLAARRQRLEVRLPEELPPVFGDPTRLTQMFVNLLANANKFAPEDSVIGIGAEQAGATVSAWVEDQGPGVVERDGNVIFERFRRGAEEEPEPGGLGLGLWIVKSIVERHEGTITVTRTADGRTRFTVSLPVEEPA